MSSAVSVTGAAVSASAGDDMRGMSNDTGDDMRGMSNDTGDDMRGMSNDTGDDMRGMIVLNETIHQQTRLRIMTLLVSVPESDRLAYGFIQQTLGLTGGNLTIHLRKLQDAGYLSITKEFVGSKPRTWAQATESGRQAFTEYLANLQEALDFRPGTQ